MKPRVVKLAIALIGASLAINTAGVAVAQAGNAPDWKVENPAEWLGAGNNAPWASTSTEITRLRVPGLGAKGTIVEVPTGDCEMTGQNEGAAVHTPGRQWGIVTACSKAAVSQPAGCTVASPGLGAGDLDFNNMESILVWLGSTGEAAAADLYAKEEGEPLIQLVFSGATCGVTGKYSLSGEIITPFNPIAQIAQSMTQTFSDPAISKWWNNVEPAREEKGITQLTLGGKNATLQSVFKVTPNTVKWIGIFGG